MMARIFLFACFWCGVCPLIAADELLPRLKVGSEVFENVTITSVTATHVYFNHSRGLGNARLKDLEPELQRHFHFDPAKAATIMTAQAQANAAYSKALRDAPPPKRQVEPAQNSGAAQSQEVQPHPIY